ncbi:MAG: hemolysin family protein [Candidatus Hydrothermales bacterium]
MELSFTLIITFLISLSFLCSGFETAFVSLDIDKIFMASSKYARKVLLRKPREILNTILLVNNLVNASIAILFTSFFTKTSPLWKAVFSGTFWSFFLIIIVGEFLPKYAASKFPFQFIKYGHHIIFFFYFIFSPFINTLTKIYHKLLKVESESKRDELLWLILEKERMGIIPPEIARALKSSLYFSEKEVVEVLKPRTELVAINIDDPLEYSKKLCSNLEYNKIPVFKDKLDNIIGYIQKEDIKDCQDVNDLSSKIRKILFFTENTKLERAVREMKNSNIPIAIVVDEHGNIKGFFTIEDVVSELIGEFYEFEKDLIVDGKTRIDDLKELYGIIFPKGRYETLAGFLIELKGDLPKENEVLEFNDYKFQVISRDQKSIKKIRISLK